MSRGGASSAAAAGGDGPSSSKPGTSIADLFSRQRLSQKFGADLLQQQQQAGGMRSGDADVPLRKSLGDRRAAYDASAARRAVAAGVDDEGMGVDGFGGMKRGRGGEEGGEEDEFYQEAEAARKAAKAARKEKYQMPMLAAPLPDQEVSGQRAINQAIEKNRGLTPHR